MSEREESERKKEYLARRKERMLEMGLRLRTLRLDKGLSQIEFARGLGVAPSTITQVETGMRPPSASLREALYSKYQFDITDRGNRENVLPKGRKDMSLNETLKQIRLDLGYSRIDFAKETGLGFSTVTNLENKMRPISPVVAHRIKASLGIDIYTYKSKKENNTNENIVAIPFYNIGASAGAGTMLLDTPEKDVLYFDDRWLRNILGLNPKNLHLIYASGDSMDSGWNQPTDIKDGDLLLVDTSQKEGNGKTYVIRVNNQELRVKKLTKRLDGTLIITSNNPKYPEEIYKSDNQELTIEIIGKVVWNGSKETI